MVYNLTKNESRVINFLARNRKKYSINELGKKLSLSPRGIYKILKKLEKLNIIIPEKLSNAIYYKLNLNNELAIKLAEFVLTDNELNSYAKVLLDDFKQLKEITFGCILFGSVLRKGREANDIDILFIIEKDKFKELNNKLEKIQDLKPKKINPIMQTKDDLAKNIMKNDEVILEIIKNGAILWGSEAVIEAIKNGTSSK